MASSSSLQAVSMLSNFAVIGLELSTEDVETVIEVPSYTVSSFLSDVGGNFGIFFGLSLLQRQYSKDSKKR